MDDMNDNHSAESQEGQPQDKPKEDLPAATLIGANIAGINAGPWEGAIAAPAANAAEEEIEQAKGASEEEEEEEDLGPIDVDALAQFASDEEKSPNQDMPTGQGGPDPAKG